MFDDTVDGERHHGMDDLFQAVHGGRICEHHFAQLGTVNFTIRCKDPLAKSIHDRFVARGVLHHGTMRKLIRIDAIGAQVFQHLADEVLAQNAGGKDQCH